MAEMSISLLVGAFSTGYLTGSIPFGLVLTRLAGLGDVREIGSGNTGATNVLRTGRKDLAAATLLLDMAKGFAPVLIFGLLFGQYAAVAAGFGAFLGHIFSFWLKFKGGKGVATCIGVIFGLYWPAALIFIFAWLISAYVTRYSSLSALIASAISPLVAFIMGQGAVVTIALALFALIIFAAHHENIGRLIRGEESKIGGSS